jgi:hydrogenase expression/formation protein HypE
MEYTSPSQTGRSIPFVPPEEANAALEAMKAHPLGQGAKLIGHVRGGEAGRVTMRTGFGGNRIVDMLVGEQLPRIC